MDGKSDGEVEKKSPGSSDEDNRRVSESDTERRRRHRKKRHHRSRRDHIDENENAEENKHSRRHKHKKKRKHHRKKRHSPGKSISDVDLEGKYGVAEEPPAAEKPLCDSPPAEVVENTGSSVSLPEEVFGENPDLNINEVDAVVEDGNFCKGSSPVVGPPIRKMAGFLPAKLSLPKAITSPTSKEEDDLWNDSITGVSLEGLGVSTKGDCTDSSPTSVEREAVMCATGPGSLSPPRRSSRNGKDAKRKYTSSKRHEAHSRSCSCDSWSSDNASPGGRRRRRNNASSFNSISQRRRHESCTRSCSCSSQSPPRSSHRKYSSSRMSSRYSSPEYKRSYRSSRSHRSRSRSRSPRRKRSPARYSRSAHSRRYTRSPVRYRSRSPRRHRSRSPRRYRSRSPPSRYRKSISSPIRRTRNFSKSPPSQLSVSPRRQQSKDSGGKPDQVQNLSTVAASSSGSLPGFPLDGPKHGLARFTDLCSKISGKCSDDKAGADNETSRPVRHPFAIPIASTLSKVKATVGQSNTELGQLAITASAPQPAQLQSIGININDIVAQLKARDPVLLRQSFPVSTGVKHQTAEDNPEVQAVAANAAAPSGKPTPAVQMPALDMSIVSRRLALQQRLSANPRDFEAMSAVANLQAEIAQHCAKTSQAQAALQGQEARLKPLSKAELEAGNPAWAKKDMFHHLNPVREGFGSRMLRKHGWLNGQPLGKSGEGYIEPVPITFKSDRKGLASLGEGPGRKSSTTVSLSQRASGGGGAGVTMSLHSLAGQGKHPVSLLTEHCSRMRVPAPSYDLVRESGPQHSKMFQFKVTIQGADYTSPSPLNNKKQAKAAAALAAVQALGLQ